MLMRSDRYKDEPVIKKKKKHGTLKALLVLIIFLAAAIAAATAYFYKSAYDSLALTFTDDSPVLDFGGEYRALDFVKEYGGEIIPETEFLDATSVGSKKVNFTVEQPILGGLLKPVKEYSLTYNVVDSIPPLMLHSGDGAVVERGTEFDISSIVSYADNADPDPLVSVDGKVDTSKNGNYPIHVKVTDASGNDTEWDLTVTVADSVPVYTYESDPYAFSAFVSDNKGKGKSFGLDISAWQDEVDFKALRKAGCEFVMIRVGYTSDGNLNLDKQFKRNLEGAKAAGIKTGIYYYSTDRTEEEVRNAAQWIMENLGGHSPDLPIAFDWEDFETFQNYRISLYELNSLYDAFADELSTAGYGCMLYGSKTYLENVWDKTDTRPVWLAHYTEKTDYDGPFMMWQASSSGRISGINGDVDMDILYNN